LIWLLTKENLTERKQTQFSTSTQCLIS
jgi:hypothetical protein